MTTKNIRIRRPSFIKGIGRVLDLGFTINFHIYNDDPDEIDYKAIQSDWVMVGEDIKFAINKYKRDTYGRTK